LRGYLALCVLAHHFVLWLQVTRLGGAWGAPAVPFFNQLGAGAVSLFFMVTGLVFYPRILAGFSATPWAEVLTNRVFRIMPLLSLSVAIIVGIAAWRSGQPVSATDTGPLLQWVTAWKQPDLVGYREAGRINAYVLWSIKCEWLFYAIVLPLAAALRDMTRAYLPSIVIPISLCLVAILDRYIHIPFAMYLPLFAGGMFAYEVAINLECTAIFKSRFVTIATPMLLVAAASFYATPLSIALPIFTVFFTCVVSENDSFGLLRHPAASVLGEISFSVYLLHGILLSLFFVEGHTLTDALPTALLPLWLPILSAVIVLLASVTYLAIERPAIRMGVRIARNLAKKRRSPMAIEADIAP
ncbi:MAG: acyltransferase, partial [Oxalobacteraceae bacterium]